jgi:hypothetical protein
MRLGFIGKSMPYGPVGRASLGSGASWLAGWVIALYAAFLLLWAFLWEGRLPFYIDSRLYAYPDRWINLEAFHQGFIPLWDPYIGCGTPHLANWQSACFYPPFWFFNLTGLNNWFMWMALIHQALAFAGCFLWLQSQKIGRLLSALGALTFAGSATLVCYTSNLPFLATAAWIPWIFWAFQRALGKPGFSPWGLASLFLSLQILAGYPFFTFYTVIFLVLWFEFQRPSCQAHFRFFASLGLAALLTCLQWLPFLDFLTHSSHETWNDYPYFTKAVEYLTLLKPDVLGVLGSTAYRGSFANANFNLYFGLIPLLALAAGLFMNGPVRFWALGALAWVLWLAGPRFILNFLPVPWLEWVETSKAAVIFVFCAVTGAAAALNRLFSARKAKGIILLLVGTLSLLWVGDIFRVPFLLLRPMPDPYRGTALQEQAARVKERLGTGRLLSIHLSGELVFSGDEVVKRAFEAPTRMFLPNSNAIWGLRSSDQYLFQNVEGSVNLMRYRYKGFPYSGDLFDIAGARLFLLPQTLPASKYRALEKLGDNFLILNSRSSPDMRWAPDRAEYPDRPSILNRLTLENSGWLEKVYLERKPGGSFIGLPAVLRSLKASAPPGYQRPSGSRASWSKDNMDDGCVVFNETFSPGWRAWVDGKPAGIWRAYGLFMAVPVAKGSRRVDFRYEPAGFRLGLFLSLLALSFLAAGSLKRVLSRS